MSKMITPSEKRKGQRKILTHFVVPAVAFWLLAKFTAGMPGLGAVLTAAALAGLTVRTTRYDPSEQAGPDRGGVTSADLTLVLAAVFGLLAAGKAGPLGPTVVCPVVLIILAVAAHRLHADGSRAAALVAAYRLAWRTRRADAAVALTAGAAIGTGIALAGLTVGAVIGTAVALAPAIRLYQAARAEQDLRAAVESALAGAFSGGPDWTPVRANAGRAPIRRFTGDADGPLQVVLPLPPTAAASAQASQADEITARLAPWGLYAVSHSTGRDRTATVRRVPPLPTSLAYDGRPAEGRKVWLGKGQVNREMVETQPHLTVGDQYDVEIDYALMPHTLIVGGTGAGKSIAMNLIAAQWLRGGNRLVVLDPKRVGFTRLRDKAGVLTVAVDVEDIADVMGRMRAEMMARYAVLEARQLDNVYDLPEVEQPPAVLIIFDEASEALGQEKVGKDDVEGQAANAAKARIAADLNSIVRLGRAAAVHCLVGAQRADATDISGQTKAQLEGRILLGVADQTARGMAGFGSTGVSATPGVRGRGIVGKVNTAPAETQIAYCSVQDLDKWLPVAGDDVVDVSADATVVERFKVADGESDRLSVLRDALDAGALSDEDAQACGYRNTAAVRTILSDWQRRLDAPEPRTVFVPPARSGQPVVPADRKPQAGDDADGEPKDKDKPAYRFKTAKPYAPGEAQEALDSLIGLPGVKREITELRASVEMAVERRDLGIGDGKVDLSHLVFAGAPGTGKTTVARIVGSLLRDVGALTCGHVVEVDRSDLVGQYVGQTAPRVAAAFDAANGGVLFIDEAYALSSDSFGKEAVDTIVKRSEDDRGEVLVIVAGYTAEMETFLDQNPGLRSRFPGRITFEDYDDESLARIYRLMVEGKHRVLDEDAEAVLAQVVAAAPRGKDWGNARSVRVMVDAACRAQDTRLTSQHFRSRDDLTTLTAADVREGAARVAGQASVDRVEDDGPDGAAWLASLLDGGAAKV